MKQRNGVRGIGKFKTGTTGMIILNINYLLLLTRILAKLDSVVVQLKELNHRLGLQDREVEDVKEMLQDIKAKI